MQQDFAQKSAVTHLKCFFTAFSNFQMSSTLKKKKFQVRKFSIHLTVQEKKSQNCRPW